MIAGAWLLRLTPYGYLSTIEQDSLAPQRPFDNASDSICAGGSHMDVNACLYRLDINPVTLLALFAPRL